VVDNNDTFIKALSSESMYILYSLYQYMYICISFFSVEEMKTNISFLKYSNYSLEFQVEIKSNVVYFSI